MPSLDDCPDHQLVIEQVGPREHVADGRQYVLRDSDETLQLGWAIVGGRRLVGIERSQQPLGSAGAHRPVSRATKFHKPSKVSRLVALLRSATPRPLPAAKWISSRCGISSGQSGPTARSLVWIVE